LIFVSDPVEDIERGSEQDRGQQPVINPLPVLPVEPLWEMRMKGKDGIARAAYVTATGKRVVVVHVFPKKTQKTPRREIEKALRRAKEVK